MDSVNEMKQIVFVGVLSVKSDCENKRMPESTILLQRGKKRQAKKPPKDLSCGFVAVINAVGSRDF